ncbi:MAG: ATP synthase F1 subunit gamma [Bacteroidales bacterium]|jgi:F-type H+-transporting ATPase subunit gamma|nr:ATP synthase F1 subunit gamma [Bacteroidales bacterium]
MASLKELKGRIVSITSTRQITSAMKMVAAAKLKKAQDGVIQIRPYANKLKEILTEVSSGLNKEHSSIYSRKKEVKNVLIVLLASNRGLCGAFNGSICKRAMQYVQETYPSQLSAGNVKFFTIGKKATEYIEKCKFNIVGIGDEIYDDLTFSGATMLAELFMKEFVNGEFDKIDIIYNSFRNAAVYSQTVEQFLPMALEITECSTSSEFILEPSVESIVDEMIPKSLKIQFFKILLDSFAAEQGARMTAMHQATDNASELIKELTLMYNKARQASITNELIEITSGAEALK